MHSPYITPHRDLLISALGPLQVYLGTALIRRFEFERVRALLLYLAVEGISHERSWLAYMFWPDATLKTGLQNVRQTLAALKRALQTEEPQREEPLLVTTPTTIGLNSNSVYGLDAENFAALIAANEKHNHRRLESCRVCMERLEQAVALYRGDFAQGVTVDSEPFESWMLRKQEQFHSQVTRALGTLSDYFIRQRDYTKGLHYARALLALDPHSDVGHHNLIHALAGDNQRHTALKQCRAYEKVLRTELGLTLPTRTAQLQMHLISEDWDPWMVVHSPAHNLPGMLNSTIGYEKELTTIHDRLSSGKDRLLTLSGIAGVGKTRLAIETAWQELPNFRDGVFFIGLESILAGGVLAAIASILTPMSDLGSATNQRLSRYLRDKEILLILDGFDHLIQSDAAVLRWLLLDAPHLQLLVTSRERLRLQGESCISLTGLDYPTHTPTRALESYDAVRFFVDCTRGWQPNFTLDNEDDTKLIIEMCQNVGGNPRALDLYAQVARFFPLAQIVGEFDRLTHLGEALNRDLLPRHRSLKSMFQASWSVLSREERRALVPLAIFPDTFTLTAAQEISKVDSGTILSLLAKSCLCVARPAAPSQPVENPTQKPVARFYVPKLLRVYLWQTLERVPALMKQVARTHAMYFMSTLNQNVTTLHTACTQSQAVTLKLIGSEKANLDQAMMWAVQDGSTAIRAQIEQDLTAVYSHESRLWNPTTREHTHHYHY